MNDYISGIFMLERLHTLMTYRAIAEKIGLTEGALRGILDRRTELKVINYLRLRELYTLSAPLLPPLNTTEEQTNLISSTVRE